MIYSYGVSLPGTYHIKNDIVCQDYHKIIHSGKDMAVAAVADGLGSAEYADIGSKIAATVAVEYCEQHITSKSEAAQILDSIKAAFSAAYRAVENEAAGKGHDPDKYDTTLTLAVLIRDTLYYGHSGDSGMIALTTNGRYEAVTTQQRDEQGCVFPLFFKDKWEFAQYSEKVSGVLLATDGMLETFFPIYIKNEPVNIHVSLARYFMDNRSLRIHKLGREAAQDYISAFMEDIPDEQVNDDKTVAVLINRSVRTKRQPEEYYQEPDWAELKKKHDEAWRREAYPGLYKDAKPSTEATSDLPTANQTTEKQLTSQPTIPQVSKLPKPSQVIRKVNKLRVFLLFVMAVGLLAGVAIPGYVFVISPLVGNNSEYISNADYNSPEDEREGTVQASVPESEENQPPTPEPVNTSTSTSVTVCEDCA